MLPYQERVIEEKRQLDDKLFRLGQFILDSGAYNSLPIEEVQRLNRQMKSMEDYSDVLGERIAAFSNKE